MLYTIICGNNIQYSEVSCSKSQLSLVICIVGTLVHWKIILLILMCGYWFYLYKIYKFLFLLYYFKKNLTTFVMRNFTVISFIPNKFIYVHEPYIYFIYTNRIQGNRQFIFIFSKSIYLCIYNEWIIITYCWKKKYLRKFDVLFNFVKNYY